MNGKREINKYIHNETKKERKKQRKKWYERK